MFNRDATPKLKTARELLAMSEAETRALSDAELDELIEHFRRSLVVRKKKLHLHCVDRRCRRLGTCTAVGRRCLCADVPRMGKRDRKRDRKRNRRASQVRAAAA